MLFELSLLLFKVVVSLLIAAFICRAVYLGYHLKDVPSPPSSMLLGHLNIMKNPKKILQQLLEIQREYGGFVKFGFLFVLNIFLITDVKLIELILNGTKFLEKGREYLFLNRWLGTGLLTAGAEKWKKTRKIITPTFHFQILEQFIEIYHSASNILIDKLKTEIGKKETDIYPYVTLCALDVICESAMGVKIDAQIKSDSEYVKSVQLISKIIRKRIFYPAINFFYLFTRAYVKERTALKVLHGHTNSVIKGRRQALKEKGVKVEVNRKTRLAFLDLLLESTINERPMTDEEIREEVDTFMFEGHDTTSSATAFTLYSLGQHKDIQDKVLQELKTIFGDDKKRMATFEELQEMKYLEMVIKESLRLYPPVPFISRRGTADTKYYGGILPRLSTLGISIFNLHRDPNIFPDPDKFDPERFTLENQQTRNPFSYIPFSAGPRNCIGQRFAMMELKSTLAKILRNFEIFSVEDFELMLVPDAILKSLNGVKVRLEERHF